MEFAIPIITNKQDIDWTTIEKTGCFAIEAPPIVVDFLRKVHERYVTTGVNQSECSGRNTLKLDPESQIIRLFVLDQQSKQPFYTGYGFEEVCLFIKNLLNELWEIICVRYGIQTYLTQGEDSAGMHHYPRSKNALHGLKGHIDSTLLVCNLPTGPGLQVYYNNKWHDAYLKDHMIINIGYIGHLLSGLPPCIHKVNVVDYDRSVVAFSPGFDGILNGMNILKLIRAFFDCFDQLEITNDDDLVTFKQMIIDSYMKAQ